MSTSNKAAGQVRASAAGSPKSNKGMSGTTGDDPGAKVGQGGGGSNPPPGDDRGQAGRKRPQKHG